MRAVLVEGSKANVSLTRDDLAAICGVLNEVCYGLPKQGFENRIGVGLEIARELHRQAREIYHQLRAAAAGGVHGAK